MKRLWAAAACAVVEALERRTMTSASPLAISEVPVGNGTELRIVGRARANKITLSEQDGELLVTDNRSSQTIAGQFADIKIFGGAGPDSIRVDTSVSTDCFLYGGAGRNLLQGGGGNDTLVCVGSVADTLIGGAGDDSFWLDSRPSERVIDATPDEIAGGAIHRVSGYYAGSSAIVPVVSAKARAQAVEPGTTNGATYENFSDHPLFSPTGPAEDDIVQGQVGDCYFLSVLSSVAKLDPNRIRQSILDMGDGAYLVQFSRANSNVFVRVDGQLPVLSNGQLDYAGLGAGGSIWAAIMEKAYVVFHGPGASYRSIDGGWMDEAYAALGALPKSDFGGAGAATTMSLIASELSMGESVTYGTNLVTDGAPLIASHAYTVDGVVTDATGTPAGLRLRNPWGIDGAGNDGSNDGYVTITGQQAYDCLAGDVAAFV
ncbi:MAG TPA: C2 family cysteine protease [Tepidisphaeraceae bacterium]|jgi:hypothetical protein